jgi:putative ABC transport system permease protein
MLLRMLFRNALRHKLRTLLTVGGMAVAILAFCLLRTVIDAWYAGVEASSATRLVTRNAISLIFPLPLSYREKIRSVDGVTAVTYGNWFGGYYVDNRNFFANFAVEGESYLGLYPEYILPPDQEAAFLRDRKGAIAGRGLADRFGWEVGDTVVLTGTIFPGNWEFTLRGIYSGRDQTVDQNQFFFHWANLNETVRAVRPGEADRVGFFIEGVARPELAAPVAAGIDEMFKNSVAETLTETERAFQLGFVAMSQAIIAAVQLVSLVVILIILVVVANTMAMAVRERMKEFSVLKTLGFGAGHIALLIFGESLLLSALGGGLGMLLTFPAAQAFSRAVGQFFPVFRVTGETMAMAAGAIIAVGVTAALFPTVTAVRVRIVEGLRRLG